MRRKNNVKGILRNRSVTVRYHQEIKRRVVADSRSVNLESLKLCYDVVQLFAKLLRRTNLHM